MSMDAETSFRTPAKGRSDPLDSMTPLPGGGEPTTETKPPVNNDSLAIPIELRHSFPPPR